MRIFTKVFGVHIAIGRWFGNCFSPALVLEWHGRSKLMSYFHLGKPVKARAAWATLTIRTSFSCETRIYWRGWWRFDCNSQHIARRWGKFRDTDFGGYWTYSGILGTHVCF